MTSVARILHYCIYSIYVLCHKKFFRGHSKRTSPQKWQFLGPSPTIGHFFRVASSPLYHQVKSDNNFLKRSSTKNPTGSLRTVIIIEIKYNFYIFMKQKQNIKTLSFVYYFKPLFQVFFKVCYDTRTISNDIF